MSQETENRTFNTTNLFKFIDEIVDDLNDLENEIANITDSSVGDVQYYIDDCSHTAESIKEELNNYFEEYKELDKKE